LARTLLNAGFIKLITGLLQNGMQVEAYQLADKELPSGQAGMLKSNLESGRDALGSLLEILDALPLPPVNNHGIPATSWEDTMLDEYSKLNEYGVSYITRISDCIVKTQALVNLYQKDNRKRALFRGQHNSSWSIRSSLGRKVGVCRKPKDRTQTSRFEISCLKKWQKKVRRDKVLKQEVFGNQKIFHNKDVRWWALKQHFDDCVITGGTRMIDFTSNPLCGLYFACVNWDGTIDLDNDGVLYFLTSKAGRLFGTKDKVEMMDENYMDDVPGDSAYNYFSIKGDLETPRTLFQDDASDRQLAQDGYFIFHPEFEKPITNWAAEQAGQSFCFIIPKEKKEFILKELYTIGYTPQKIIRGHKGELAHARLIDQLGIIE
jgi:hypothetical protein